MPARTQDCCKEPFVLGFRGRVRVGGSGKVEVVFIAGNQSSINQLASPASLRIETFGNEGERDGGRPSFLM